MLTLLGKKMITILWEKNADLDVCFRSYSCSYKITADSTYSDVVIQIKVHNASLEPATGCWRDSVEIIDGRSHITASILSGHYRSVGEMPLKSARQRNTI